MNVNKEIYKRKTFAIISHPDAGKTTLTEKLLLYGGAIQVAGAVKSNKIKKTATSDFMEIEKQRGISVATSVMTFEYKDMLLNILDTPGHKDFAEDTYRTLTAVDSVILVIDVAKGVETQTKKLMEVCRMRNTPVMVFVNKMDREGKDPFELMDELEKYLNIRVRPLSWGINMGQNFKGVYKLYDKTLNLFTPGKNTLTGEDNILIKNLNDSKIDEYLGDDAGSLREDVELIEEVYDDFDTNEYLAGNLAPVFFGSALNNFGVKELLDTFVEIAPHPTERPAGEKIIKPVDQKFSGFVFKIHANIDPRHRDRIAFFRVCSGKFERNKFFHHVRLKKNFRFSNPASFMASKKEVLEEAYPGDVIGLYDTGNFKIGDTLTEGEQFFFSGIPSFSPEIFKEVVNRDPMKSKQLNKGIRQLTDEGVAQLFVRDLGNIKVIGTVGELQFDVIKYRLKHEYGALCDFRNISYHKACWLTSDNKKQLDEFVKFKANNIYKDKDDNYVFMAESQWMLNVAIENYPDITFHFTSEFKTGLNQKSA